MRYDESTPQAPHDPREPVGVDDKPSRTAYGAAAAVLGAAAALGVVAWLVVGRDEVPDTVREEVSQARRDVVEEIDEPSDLAAMEQRDETEPGELTPSERLRDAQAQVESLQLELNARNAELVSLKAEVEKRDAADETARERARVRQAAVQKEITSLKEALAAAETERDQLRTDLKSALAEIDKKVEENRKLRTAAVAYKSASSENLWAAFTNNAKVRICDRGTHRRRENCEEELDSFFNEDQHAAFTNCVNTYQAMPMLWEADDQAAPTFAQRVTARDRERKDEWYVVYCDPTLPENRVAKDITEEVPQIFVASADSDD